MRAPISSRRSTFAMNWSARSECIGAGSPEATKSGARSMVVLRDWPMPELKFQIVGVEFVERSLVPLLHFTVDIANQTPSEPIQSVMLQAQIQIQAPQRAYNASEKDKLRDLFGPPEDWGRTLGPKFREH